MSSKLEKIILENNYREKKNTNFLIQRYAPYSLNYFDRLNPLFFEQYDPKLDQVALLRDGLWGIINLFYTYPSPPSENHVLFVPCEFENMIPARWKDQVFLYQDEILQKDKENIDYFVLTTHFTQDFFFYNSLDELIDKLPENGYEKYFLCNNFQSNIFSKKINETNLRNEGIKAFVAKYGQKAEIISDFYTFFLKNNFKNFSFLPFEKESLLIRDSYTNQVLSSKGANCFSEQIKFQKSPSLTYNLSQFHARNIYHTDTPYSRFPKVYIELRKILKGQRLRYDGTYYLMMCKRVQDILCEK